MAVLAVLAGCGESAPEGAVPASTQPVEETSFSFIVCGDPQNNYEVFDRVLQACSSVDFLIIAGDLTGSGTATEFETFLQHMEGIAIPYYCVPGNHDVATSPAEGNYMKYIGAPYQSFDYQNAHFILIDNSTPSLGFYPAEREWARSDLEEAARRKPEHVFAVCHVPPGYPYSARASRDQIAGLDANRFLVPLLAEGGVDQLFCGHYHSYVQEEEDDMLITITGGAGAPLMGPAEQSYYHYVLVEVKGRQLEQKVVRI